MFDWFKSRYTRSLEERLAELKTTHAAELDYVKKELAWHKDEAERLRTFLIPTMQPVYDHVRAVTSTDTTPAEADPYAGLTPWQRVMKKDLEQQEEEFKASEAKRKREAAAEKPAVETVQ